MKGSEIKPGTPWPSPQSWASSDRVFTINPNYFYFNFEQRDCYIINEALRRLEQTLFPNRFEPAKANLTLLTEFRLLVNDTDSCLSYKQSDDDERYELLVKPDYALISAENVWGILYGLETLSQLIYQENGHYGAYLINETRIIDWPSYKYRGLLLDTARHFIPVSILYKNLDAMLMNKMNVFHWHLVDDQSFPFESKIYPNLTLQGAYTRKHVYTQDNIRTLIEYARVRGIRVIPEIDSPGHTKAMGKSMPEILTPCYKDGKKFAADYPNFSQSEVLNPILNQTYIVMRNLFRELKSVFKDEYLHLGMDEVYYGCWSSNPNIKKFMDRYGMTTINQIEQFYVRNILRIVQKMDYKYIMYQDPIDNGVQVSFFLNLVNWVSFNFENVHRQQTTQSCRSGRTLIWTKV